MYRPVWLYEVNDLNSILITGEGELRFREAKAIQIFQERI